MTSPHIWLRAESKPKEERTALTPNDARQLLAAGFKITVERSPLRAYPDEAYDRVGCILAPTGHWLQAPLDAFILGLKELPEADFELKHRHIYFAHVYKNQQGWQRTLGRFHQGGGALLDLEYLTDASGRRVAAFGHWAGFVGAGVGAAVWAHRQTHGTKEPVPMLSSWPSQEQCVADLRERVEAARKIAGHKPTAIVIGAKGRCGRGATECLERLGFEIRGWDLEETRRGGPFREILE
ncbi:MAG: hypothetical protein IT285_04150, partial [Bdellovibrionales bacterium]|nr:hypothetical protein [Bdellovibrionales bacterium]